MTRRVALSLFVASLLGVSASLVLTAQEKFTPTRTAWGDPDIQGMWTNPTLTPLERPAALGDKAFLTPEEAAAAEARAANAEDGPPRAGDPGTYNRFWTDSGTKVVGDLRTSLVVEPKNGRVPLTPLAESLRDTDLARSADSWEYMSVWDRCITRGLPGAMLPAGYNNAYRIVQTPGYVTIYYEMIHDVRIIPLDGRPHLSPGLGLWMGDSRGRWEGNTLVVDVTNYNGRGWISTSAAGGRIKGIHQTANAHIVERFTRTAADTIAYEARIEDPEMYTEPWTVAIPLGLEADYQLYEYACHEGNTAVPNILRGGRANDGARTTQSRR